MVPMLARIDKDLPGLHMQMQTATFFRPENAELLVRWNYVRAGPLTWDSFALGAWNLFPVHTHSVALMSFDLWQEGLWNLKTNLELEISLGGSPASSEAMRFWPPFGQNVSEIPFSKRQTLARSSAICFYSSALPISHLGKRRHVKWSTVASKVSGSLSKYGNFQKFRHSFPCADSVLKIEKRLQQQGQCGNQQHIFSTHHPNIPYAKGNAKIRIQTKKLWKFGSQDHNIPAPLSKLFAKSYPMNGRILRSTKEHPNLCTTVQIFVWCWGKVSTPQRKRNFLNARPR
jgi:hypothetical protein